MCKETLYEQCFLRQFETLSFWQEFNVPLEILFKKFDEYFGTEEKVIEDRDNAVKILMKISKAIQDKMINRIKSESTYGLILKLYYIFGEVHSLYLTEKKKRTDLAKQDISDSSTTQQLLVNRNIERNIIDACNIWLENCVLHQHDIDLSSMDIKKEFVMDLNLLIDMYIYGLVSQSISLLILSNKLNKKNTFYGLKRHLNGDIPIEVLKYRPLLYNNIVITGNQSELIENPITQNTNNTEFGKGFRNENNIEFLLFLAVLHDFKINYLHDDDKSLAIIGKKKFIQYIETVTNPSVDGQNFYDNFVLTKGKTKMHLKHNEDIVWVVGANKYRHEIRPFIGLDDDNVIINYGALEQASHLWISYCSNGGMCYTNPSEKDALCKAMDKMNEYLSDTVLVSKLQEILHSNYTGTVDLKNVDYQCIFGKKEKNYGDYDIVFYVAEEKELFLIESKFFSDSLNSSGLVNDYNKLFGKDGYYSHCRSRYDLVLSEPEKMKAFVNATEDISVHMLFISSKPLEIDLQDEDGVVTFLSLGIFEKYINGELRTEDGNDMMRPTQTI